MFTIASIDSSSNIVNDGIPSRSNSWTDALPLAAAHVVISGDYMMCIGVKSFRSIA
jgi:hypothetical protein